MNKKSLKEYVEYLVENILSEEEGLDLTSPDDKPEENDTTATEDNTDLNLGDTGDISDTTDDNSDTTDDSGLDLGNEGDSSLDLSSGGSGGFSGGGGGFGFSSPGDEKSETQNDNKDLQVQTQPVELDDPTKETVEMAKKLSGMVGDIQTIVNAVKSNIQSYYDDPTDAIEIVQELWDSDNPKLRLTAIKLLMFIRGY